MREVGFQIGIQVEIVLLIRMVWFRLIALINNFELCKAGGS